jgi:nucleotidyltransferase/DNA polymerase involved in DNA repair
MTTARTIIHLDLDAFFCAVEEQRDLSLRSRRASALARYGAEAS